MEQRFPSRACVLGLVLFQQVVAEPSVARQTWYMVDTPSVVCTEANPPAAGEVNITVPLEGIRAANLQDQPHVFTFYRTTRKATSVTFQVLDAEGKSVVRKNTVDLRELARRLGAEVPARDLRGHAGGRSHGGFAKGSGLGSKYSSPRRRSPGLASARRRTMSGTSGSHRNDLSSARRRGAPAASNLPTSGVGGSHHHNAYGQHYGFTRPQTMNQYYPGGYAQTPYGFSGVNSYSPSTGAGTVMMAGVAGLAVGAGTAYMFSRWHSYDSCSSGAGWSGSCRSCYASYSPQACQPGPPRVSAHRDDVMGTGFWPADWKGPLTVIVSAVEGADFAAPLLCHLPQGNTSNTQDMQRSAVTGADLFFTLTQVDELARDKGSVSDSGLFSGAVVPFILVSVCCLCFFVAGRIHSNMQKRQGQGHTSFEDDEWLDPGRKPAVVGASYAMDSPAEDDFMTPSGSSAGFMNTMGPTGISWRKYCESQPVEIDPRTGMLGGAWGECLAWARVYETEHPEWVHNAEYRRQGPCGQVVDAVVDMSGALDESSVIEAAEKLEQACEVAAHRGAPLPVINYSLGAE